MKKFKSLCLVMAILMAVMMLAPISAQAAKSKGTIKNKVSVVMQYADGETVTIPGVKIGIKGGLLGTKFLLGSDYHVCDNNGKAEFKQTSRITDMYFELPKAWEGKVEADVAKYNAKLMGTFKYKNYEAKIKDNKFRVGMPLAWTTVDTTIYLKAKSFDVVFDEGEGKTNTEKVEYLRKAVKPAAPEKEGYTFLGWYDGAYEFNFDTRITENTTLTAKWAAKEYTVEFKDGNTVVSSQKVEHGKTAEEPADPVKAGHKFLGWFNGETEFNFMTPITEDITLTAKWEAEERTVTFNSGTDVAVPMQKVKYGEKATKPDVELEREGYNFLGWYNGEEAFDFETPITDNITLNAKWEIKKYTLTFKYLDGTSGTFGGYEHGKNITAHGAFPPVKTQVKEGFIHKGWIDENGVKFTADTIITRNMTLRPRFVLDTKIDSTTVHFFVYNNDKKKDMTWVKEDFIPLTGWGYISNASKLPWTTSKPFLGHKRVYVEEKNIPDVSKLYDSEGDELDVKSLIDKDWINKNMKEKFKNRNCELRVYRLTKQSDGNIHVDLALFDTNVYKWVHELPR